MLNASPFPPISFPQSWSLPVPQCPNLYNGQRVPASLLSPQAQIGTAWFLLFPHPRLSVVPKAHSFSKPLLIFSYMPDKVLEC